MTSLSFQYAKENIKDDLSLRFGLQLLDRLQYKNEVIEYIEVFRDYMDMDDEDINEYIKGNTVV